MRTFEERPYEGYKNYSTYTLAVWLAVEPDWLKAEPDWLKRKVTDEVNRFLAGEEVGDVVDNWIGEGVPSVLAYIDWDYINDKLLGRQVEVRTGLGSAIPVKIECTERILLLLRAYNVPGNEDSYTLLYTWLRTRLEAWCRSASNRVAGTELDFFARYMLENWLNIIDWESIVSA